MNAERNELTKLGGSWEFSFRNHHREGKCLLSGNVWYQKHKNRREELGTYAAKTVEGEWVRWHAGERFADALLKHYQERFAEAIAENARLERALHDPEYGGKLLADMHGLAD